MRSFVLTGAEPGWLGVQRENDRIFYRSLTTKLFVEAWGHSLEESLGASPPQLLHEAMRYAALAARC
jgi:hypothetical protein